VRLVLIALLALDAALAWLALQAVFVFVELIWRGATGRHMYHPLIAAHVRQFEVLRLVQAAAALATAAVFVAWLRQTRADLAALGRGPLRYSARDMATGCLIPGLNLVRPFALVRDLWRAATGRARTSPLVGWWWAVLLGGALVDGLARALAVRAGTPLDLGRGMQVLLVGGLLQIAAAVLTIALVLALDGHRRAPAPSR
jgi:hypothetical protein